ncbi:PVC-type heme-binding CxxCH protein [Fimbriiglobus ruber]|uniref:Cytochrome c domain-containing protein n=1 Tax=Fimbriiglobus ruber TaxID=1908690 RepID=A0A225E7X3_9BACT|nr:PVC-type heme-binding CxxCH protein [Fimbriiglobus ruber]OWK46868.1 hypothetical protein FRUB_00567 [Fimbriiglobus ruber]
MLPALLLATLIAGADPAVKTPPGGVLPVGADGKPLNLDFETGTLKDWTATGEAFKDQPIKGDAVAARRGDMKSGHQGEYWIGGYEKHSDKPQGTLTSVPFTVTHPWASFLVGGGSWAETCVEIITPADGKVISRTSGLENETMRRVAIDLTKLVGKEIQVRLVDKHSGGWGHLNFDDFRFHSEKPVVPARPARVELAKPDTHKYAGLPPDKAAQVMTVPEGFTVSLFAGEPDVHQPVAFCIDDRGRLWVAEAYTYPQRNRSPGPVLPAAERAGGDRILIFEDTDGDGKFDKRTVFFEVLNLVSGLAVGFDGVWVGAAPYLLFIPHDHATDKAGEPKILLDGWGYQDTHETLNTFVWGPDGYLYGCHGVFTHSNVGKPGTPDKERTPINAGIWRYHPTRHTFEVFSHGTSNPWGLDYNDVGEFFIEACVIPHCFHMIQGGRYQRQGGQHFNPYTYFDIQTIADHRHYVGANPHGGNERSDSMGGGHAHCGLMCYLGGAWPKEYRGELFMGNIHGRRINVDKLTPKGSGYVAGHGPDFLLANDAWARFINLQYGPDGNVYLIDWYDKQACHNGTPEIWDRTNGRIYKVSYRGTKKISGLDLQKCTDDELVKYQLNENDWYVRHARRILQERAAAKKLDPATINALAEIAQKNPDPIRRLRGLWALYVVGGSLAGYMDDKDPAVRGWAVRLTAELLGEGVKVNADSSPGGSAALPSDSADPVVRRNLASALQKVPTSQRWESLAALTSHTEDATDPNLPYLYWYAMEPLAEADTARALDLAAAAKVPLFPLMARRVGAIGTPEAFAVLVSKLSTAKTDDARLVLLTGLNEGLKGRRGVVVPQDWSAAFNALSKSPDAAVRSQALAVAVAFGDAKAFGALRGTLADTNAALPARQAALTALVDAKDKQLPPVLQKLVGEPALRPAAVRGLAAFDDPKTPAVLLAAYASLNPAERRDALATLTARPAYAAALLDAIGSKTIPAADVPAETIRQLRNLNDPKLIAQIAAVWGTVRDTPADRKKIISDWTRKLVAPAKVQPDLAAGRAVFAKVCAQCHTLYGTGGKVGPDITGANRADLGYLLENIFDPSAVIPKEYAATKIDLADGRVVTGIVKEETAATLTVVTANETLSVPVKDIDKRTPSPLSMMPDDLTKQVTERDLRALIAYLRHNAQVPILVNADNAKDFFNGKDLSGWDGDKDVWSVENGEIVGQTKTGLKHNTFLKSAMDVPDFRLAVKVKLTPNGANSGIQFRSVPIEGGEMRGPQADIGAGWWGKLYEESGRGLLVKEGGEQYVKPNEWNDYVVEAIGPTVKIWINGHLCADYTDEKLARRGIIGLQVHSGGPTDVRYKEIKLEVVSEKK